MKAERVLLLPVAPEKLLTPFLRRGVEDFFAGLGDWWEVFNPLVGSRRVDDRAGVEALLGRMNDRIEGAAPAATKDVDVFDRIAAGKAKRTATALRTKPASILSNCFH